MSGSRTKRPRLPLPLPVDAQAGDAGASDANGFADAVVAEGGPCMPCEAPKSSEERMPAARRPIAWGAIEEDAQSLSPQSRAVLGSQWRPRMRQEHLAVGAFALLTQELAELGCEGAVLGLVARAASDEVRHAETCRRMAVATMGTQGVPRTWRGLPRIPRHELTDASTRAVLHVVEMCCLNETLTGVFFSEMHGRTKHPAARAVVESFSKTRSITGASGGRTWPRARAPDPSPA